MTARARRVPIAAPVERGREWKERSLLSTPTIATEPMGMVDRGARAYQRTAPGLDWSMKHRACPSEHGLGSTRVFNAIVRPEGLGGSPG